MRLQPGQSVRSVGIVLAVSLGMVQLVIRMVAPAGHLEEFLQALQSVSRPAERDRGCVTARILREDERRLWYLEEWNDVSAFELQLAGERIGRLLAVLEAAAEAPSVEFRFVSATRGLEYLAEVRGRAGGDDGLREAS